MSVDPLAEDYPSHSPYNYTLNNPINFLDPDGKQVFPTGQSAVNEIKRQFTSSFNKNIVKPIEVVNKVAREGIKDGTAAYAPFADQVASGIVVGTFTAVAVQPEHVTFAPVTLAIATIVKATALGAKGLHLAAGGTEVSEIDMASDAVSLAIPPAVGGSTLKRIVTSIFSGISESLIDFFSSSQSNSVDRHNSKNQKKKEKDEEQ